MRTTPEGCVKCTGILSMGSDYYHEGMGPLCSRCYIEFILAEKCVFPRLRDECRWKAMHHGQETRCERNAMKLSDVIKVWDILHIRDTGEIGFCDLEQAIEKVMGIENDISGCEQIASDTEA